MANKIRRVDFYPDEYVAGVGARLDPAEQGVYWMVCALIYSRGGPIDNDHIWLSRLFGNTHWRTIRAILDRLISTGKIGLIEGAEGPQLTVKRCASELQKAGKRVADAAQNGGKGGRPSSKINEIDKPGGFENEKLTTNHQPPTTNQEPEEKKETRGRAALDPSIGDEFDKTFWPEYPHKVGKPAALQAFVKVRRSHELDVVMAGLARYIRDKPPDRSWLNPTTFLNQHRFNDQPALAIPETPRNAKPSHSDQIRASVAAAYERRQQATGERAERPPHLAAGADPEPAATGDHRDGTILAPGEADPWTRR